MPNYSHGKIYKLTSKHTDLIYIGSTTLKLCQRFAIHKSHWKTKGSTCSSFRLFELGNVKIELIKKYPCESSKELRKEERLISEQYINIVNIKKAFTSNLEKNEQTKSWQKNNYEKYSETSRKKYIKNKIKLNEYSKMIYYKNKTKIQEYQKIKYLKKKYDGLASEELIKCMMIKIL